MRVIYIALVACTVALIIDGVNGQGRRNSRQGRKNGRGGGGGSGGGGSGGGGGTGSRGPYTQLPQFDELLADAGNFKYGGRNEQNGRTLDQDIYTSDRKNVLFELDELEPVPCELEKTDNGSPSGAVLVQADSTVGEGSCQRTAKGGGRGRGRGNDLTGNGGNFGRGGRGKRAATSDTTLRWPSKTIAYELSEPSFESVELRSIQDAVDEYTKYTCVNFVRRTNEANYINIIRDGGCYSSVGWIHWDQPNRLSLARGCAWYKNIPIHELMHAIGIYHQQSRPDRDQYVKIVTENIQPGRTHNFFKLTNSQAVLGGTEYSYRSVMHYGRSGFSIDRANKDTIMTLDPAYQDIIGRGTTFSFEDLQLVNHIFDCDRGCSNSCPPKSYRDKNCNCYCPNESNFDEPAVLCDNTNSCHTIGQSCNCGSRSNSCSNIHNTVCNTNSGACECDSTSGLIDGQCIKVTEVNCEEVGRNCLCSMKDSNACNGLPNTFCDSGTNACKCISSHQLNGEGNCVNINVPCDRIGKSCFCSQQPNSCSGLSNSYCDLLTDKCECEEDYYVSSNAPGMCTMAPACNVIGQACQCSVQGQDACSALHGTACDTSTEACICLPSYQLTPHGTCETSNTNYISDGSSIAPFLWSDRSTSGNQFMPDQGDEAQHPYDQFGIAPNSWRLRSAGRGAGRYGVIETPTLPAGTWCIKYSYKMKYGALWSQVSSDGVYWYHRGNGANWEMRRYFRKELQYSTTTQLFVRFQAEIHPHASANESWEVLIDPIVVKRC